MGKRKQLVLSKDSDNQNENCDDLEAPEKKHCFEGDSLHPLESGNSESTEHASSSNAESNGPWLTIGRSIQPTQQLRTSIRVQLKQKREESKDVTLPPEVSKKIETPTKKIENPGKKIETPSKRIDVSSQDEEEEEPFVRDEKEKRRRAWEVWSMEDKNTFFEAINDCGKDFEAIQNCLATKLRKKDPSFVCKNKDQIRHFYYRTWHKISKHLKFGDDVKKATKELYALINYGELRRKVGGTLDEKKAQTFQELVEKGSASIKIKGKSIRIKTPICRALKRLNEIKDDRDREQPVVRVPVTITLEIVAATISSFWYVQSLAHNPRVRIQCRPRTLLSQILTFLESKWKSRELKICERLTGTPTFPNVLPSLNKPSLQLYPSKDVYIQMFNIEIDSLTSSAVSLMSHKKLLRKKIECGLVNFKPKKKKNCKQNQKNETNNVDKGDDKGIDAKVNDLDGKGDDNNTSAANTKEFDDITDSSQRHRDDVISDCELDNSPNGASGRMDSDEEISIICSSIGERLPIKIKQEPIESPTPENTASDVDFDPVCIKEEGEEGEPTHILHQLRALETIASLQSTQDDADVVYVGEKTRLSAQIREEDTDAGKDLPSEDFTPMLLKSIKKGWSLSNCENITLGELYLLFGKKKKLKLEYDFKNSDSFEPKEAPNNNNNNNNLHKTPSKNTKSQDNQTTSSESNCVHLPFNPESTNCASHNSPDQKSVLPSTSQSTSSTNPIYTKDDSDNLDISRKDLSLTLVKLLRVAKDLYSKSNSFDGCVCGYNNFAKSKVHSPGGSRLSAAVGRSPGSARSPRVKARSPKVDSPGPGSLAKNSSANSARKNPEKPKPASAKKLLPDIPEEVLPPDVSSGFDYDPGAKKQLQEKQIVTSIVASTSTTVTMTTADASMPEFRVPIGPAPRNINQAQNNIYPKMNKLRPIRRQIMRNMVVQRQLSLLPHTVPSSIPGVSNLKVLQSSASIEGISFIANPVITSPASSNNLLSGQHSQPVPKPVAPASPIPSSSSDNVNSNTSPNSISVNVSGKRLLTVKMPSLQSTQTQPLNPTIACISSASYAEPKKTIHNIGHLPPSIPEAAPTMSSEPPLLHTITTAPSTIILNPITSCALSIKSEEDPEEKRLPLPSGNFNILPLSTPPSTPRPEHDLSLDTPIFKINSSDVTPARFNLTPPPFDLENSSSVLNTPKQILPTSTINLSAISPIKLNLSSLLSSSISPKKIDALELSEPPSPAEITWTLPGLLPSSIESLPILDISMGGTVSIRDQGETVAPASDGIHQGLSQPTVSPSTGLNLSITCVAKKEEISTPENLPQPFGENSTDKLMDISFGNSNSSSNFSTLLSAASHAHLELENSNSVLQTPTKIPLSHGPHSSTSKSDAKANLNFSAEFQSSIASLASPPASPSRFLHQVYHAWLQSEVSDFSLSSFLGSLEPPVKGSSSSNTSEHMKDASLSRPTTPSGASLSGLIPGGASEQAKDACAPTMMELFQKSRNMVATNISDNSIDFVSAFAKLKAKASREK